MRNYAAIMAVGLLIGAASPALSQQNKDRQLLEQLAKDYEAAYNRQDAAGVAALYTDDTVEIRPQGVREGRAAVEKEYQGQFQAHCRDLAISIKDSQTSGDIEWSNGGWTAKCGDNQMLGFWSHVGVHDQGKLRIKQNTVVFPEPEPAWSTKK